MIKPLPVPASWAVDRIPLPENGDADENPRELMDLDEQEIDEPSGYEPALLKDGR